MTNIAAGSSQSVSMPAGSVLSVSGYGIAVMGPGAIANQQYSFQNTITFGAYKDDQVVYLTAIGSLSFSLLLKGQQNLSSSERVDIASYYGIDNTGATDVSSSLLSALQNLNGAPAILNGRFKIDSKIVADIPLDIYCDATVDIVREQGFAFFYSEPTDKKCISAFTVLNYPASSTTNKIHQLTLLESDNSTTADLSMYARGDIVYVTSDDILPETRETNTGSPGGMARKCELAQVLSVSGNTLTLFKYLEHTYTIIAGSGNALATAFIMKMKKQKFQIEGNLLINTTNYSTAPVSNLSGGSDLTVSGYFEPKVSVQSLHNNNCTLEIQSCWRGESKVVATEGYNYHSKNGFGYGFATTGCTTAHNAELFGTNQRHLGTTGAQSNTQLSNVRFRGGTSCNRVSGVAINPLSSGFDTHEAARDQIHKDCFVYKDNQNADNANESVSFSFSDRGLRSQWIDCETSGMASGFSIYPHQFPYAAPATGMKHRTIIRNYIDRNSNVAPAVVSPVVALQGDIAGKTISSLVSASGTATATTSTAHNRIAGERVRFVGASISGHNGIKTIAATPTTTTFTFADSNAGTSTGASYTVQNSDNFEVVLDGCISDKGNIVCNANSPKLIVCGGSRFDKQNVLLPEVKGAGEMVIQGMTRSANASVLQPFFPKAGATITLADYTTDCVGYNSGFGSALVYAYGGVSGGDDTVTINVGTLRYLNAAPSALWYKAPADTITKINVNYRAGATPFPVSASVTIPTLAAGDSFSIDVPFTNESNVTITVHADAVAQVELPSAHPLGVITAVETQTGKLVFKGVNLTGASVTGFTATYLFKVTP